MRLAAACLVAVALQTGCIPGDFRVGQAPMDDGWYVMRNHMMDAAPRQVNTALIAAAPAGTKREEVGWTSSGSSGEHEWSRHVRYVHPDGRVEPMPAGWTRRMRDTLEHAMLTEMESIEYHPPRPDEPVADDRFVIRYTRANGAVAGDVVGVIEPSRQYAGYTTVRVVQTEWCTR
ncbi:MAG: hypothetical protein U0804_22380 [Gemmataceae bacterium]